MSSDLSAKTWKLTCTDGGTRESFGAETGVQYGSTQKGPSGSTAWQPPPGGHLSFSRERRVLVHRKLEKLGYQEPAHRLLEHRG